METIFSSHFAVIPFLKFPILQAKLTTFSKQHATFECSKSKLVKVKADLQSNLMEESLPNHLQKRFKSLSSSSLDEQSLKDIYRIILNKEISDVDAKLSKLSNDFTELEKQFYADLDRYLSAIDVATRPSMEAEWTSFLPSFKEVLKELKQHFLLQFLHNSDIHLRKKEKKQQKFKDLKEKSNQPLVLTEKSLLDMFQKFSISRSTRPILKKPSRSRSRSPLRFNQRSRSVSRHVRFSTSTNHNRRRKSRKPSKSRQQQGNGARREKSPTGGFRRVRNLDDANARQSRPRLS